MEIKITMDDEDSERFEVAMSTYSDIVRRKLKSSEFAKFAMFWFIDGFLREDVDGSE